MELQKRLIVLRKDKQLSQEELAEKLYVSRQTISNWERGKTYPDINSLLLIATFFDVSLDYLLKGDVDIMKHHVERTLLKRWFVSVGILIFLGSFLQPIGRFYQIPNFDVINYIFLIALGYCIYRIYHLSKDNQLKTYSQILAFIEEKKIEDKPWWVEGKYLLMIIAMIWGLIILGQALGSLLFYGG